MFLITFRDRTCAEHKIIPMRRPDIPAPEKNESKTSIPGMDGALIETDECYKPIEIKIPFNFMGEPEKWASVNRIAKEWLSGSGELYFSDDENFFYRVLTCKMSETKRKSWRIGTFDAIFTCRPHMYAVKGKNEMTPQEAALNPYRASHPVYLISGNGSCTLTVNGKTMKATVGQNLTIDTDRMMAYRVDGSAYNAALDGDYEDLYLQPGENTITITSGFTLKVIPNWRCL